MKTIKKFTQLNLIIIGIISLTICLNASKSFAQEIQVPFDEDGNVMVIDAKLEEDLNLFTAYEGFVEATLYQVSDTSWVLEIKYKSGGSLTKVRVHHDEIEFAILRKNVAKAIQTYSPQTLLDQSGRAQLLTVTAATSLFYHGWALPTILEVENSKTFVGLYMLASSAGFFVPYAITKNRPVTIASARLSTYGQTRGIMHGRMLSSFIDPYGSRNRSLALGMIGGIGEGIGGYLWANNRNMSSGKASTMIVFGDLGALATLGTAHFTGFLDGQNSYDPYSGASNKALIRRTIGSYIIGNTAGMVVGSILSNNQNYTTGDAIYTGSAAAFGAYLPITLLIAAEADDVKSYSAAATLGGLAGMSLSHLVTKDKDYTTGQSVLITLGGGASGLFGLGLGYLFTSEATTAAALSGFTSLAGFVIMSKVYADKAKENQKDQAFSFQLNPEALLKLTGSTSPGISSSIVSTRFTF